MRFLYKELQFALREAVGTRTLDELLGQKGVLEREIGDVVRPKVEAHGLAVRSAGVKDVILPGEMKIILNQEIDKLTVFGGLDGVFKDVVRNRVPAA